MTLENAAIQTDVDQAEPTTGNTVRNEMMQDIAARARQERDEEIKSSGGEVVDTLNVDPEGVATEEAKPEVTQEAAQEEAKPETVKIKVDGEEREVPRDKIYDAGIRAMQKESTADKRLEEATRLLREVETKYAKPQAQSDPSPQWDDQTVAYALEHGNEEQKAYAVSLLRGRDNTTPDQIVQDTTRRVLDTVDFQESSRKFLSDFSDIAVDPYLMQLAASAEANARSNGDTRPRSELYTSIGNDLRKWKGGVSAQDSLNAKREQKSNIVNLPSASMKKTAPETTKLKTTADIIEDMRKKRGQR